MIATYQDLQEDCKGTLDQLLRAAQAGMTAPAVLALIERSETWRRAAPPPVVSIGNRSVQGLHTLDIAILRQAETETNLATSIILV